MIRAALDLGLIVAIWRVTRLLVLDEVPPVRATRNWFIRTFGVIDADGNIVAGRRWGWLGFSLAYVWTCMWCMSPWVGGALWALAVYVAHQSVAFPWLVIAAGSGLAGLLNMVEGEHEQRMAIRQIALDADAAAKTRR
jgi:hypothetical protein